MKEYQITGLGPLHANGSREIYTTAKTPFHVSAEWIAEQGKELEMGDVIKEDVDGSLTITTPQSETGREVVSQKKTVGSENLGVASAGEVIGSLISQKRSRPRVSLTKTSEAKRYVANPIMVTASQIAHVGELNVDATRFIGLDDGTVKVASPGMLARILPQAGDYWVTQQQADGAYEYLNPKEVFERKYTLVTK